MPQRGEEVGLADAESAIEVDAGSGVSLENVRIASTASACEGYRASGT